MSENPNVKGAAGGSEARDPKSTNGSSGGRGALRVIGAVAIALVALGVLVFAWVWIAPCALGGCAPLDELAEYQAEGSELLDVNGETFGTLATVNRRLVSLDSLPPHLPQAFLAIEDQRFYDHGGVDIWRTLGAMVSNVRAGGVTEGGSTITQQLARNLFPEWLPYQERSLKRKLMEARVARQIERTFDKNKILELYLNHIYLGEGAYGVEAAAQAYFGKPAAEVTLEEAALLGGLPKAPSQINPVTNLERATERRNLVLEEMADAGFVSQTEASEARSRDVELAEGATEAEMAHGSYFVERVRQEMEEIVGSRFYTAGLRIHTTFDSGIQQAAEEELSRQLNAIESGSYGTYRHPTYSAARGESEGSGKTPYLQGAVIVMEASTGEVRALVGGRDFADSKFDRATQAMRQPGSAFKPFVYLAALERFGTPAHQVEDSPVRLALSGGRTWEPRNYTGTYDGTMTMRDALARSKNAATVHLAQEVGMRAVIQTARQMGIESDIPNVPSAALGATEVRPMEITRAYAAFANGGHRVRPHLIRRVVDRHGRTLWEMTPERERAIDPAEAFVITSMLRDVVDRGTGSAVRSAGFRGPAAGKTGTTNDATDAWFIGYTPELVGTVWLGLDDPKTIVRGASGGTLAAPLWARIMNRAYQNRPMPDAWQPPSGLYTEEVEQGSGLLVGEACPAQGPTYEEYFLRSRPMERVCPDTRYTSYTGPDSLWIDEEWSVYGDDPTMDTTAVGRQGRSIDWPELDDLRERIRLGTGRSETPDREPEPEPEPSFGPLGRPESSPAPSQRSTTPAEPRADEPATPPASSERAPEPPASDRPRLLGTPVQRDTTTSGRSEADRAGSGTNRLESRTHSMRLPAGYLIRRGRPPEPDGGERELF